MSFLKRLFGDNRNPREKLFDEIINSGIKSARENQKAWDNFDEDAELKKYLAGLPRCSKYVLIASPFYELEGFNGEVVAYAAKLQPWMVDRVKGATKFGMAQVVFLATPQWLEQADLSNESITVLSPELLDNLSDYAYALVRDKIAFCRCSTCHKSYDDITMVKLNQREEGQKHFWTDEWRCPEGHIIYRKDTWIRLFCSH